MLDKLRYITTEAEASRYVAQLAAQPIIGVDIETMPLPEYVNNKQGGLDPYLSQPRLFQAAALDGRIAVFDMATVSATSIIRSLVPCPARPGRPVLPWPCI